MVLMKGFSFDCVFVNYYVRGVLIKSKVMVVVSVSRIVSVIGFNMV